jgi:hypothetical protein
MDVRNTQVVADADTRPEKDLKELEELLNTFDGLCTIETSEGGEGELAYILLKADEGKDLFAVAQRLSRAMATVIKTAEEWLTPLYYADLSVEWTGEKDHCFICLSFSPFKIKEIVKGFHDVQIEFSHCNKNIPQ